MSETKNGPLKWVLSRYRRIFTGRKVRTAPKDIFIQSHLASSITTRQDDQHLKAGISLPALHSIKRFIEHALHTATVDCF